MRPWRMGTSSGTRLSACSSSSATGSGRSAAGPQFAWLFLGASRRAAFPCAAHSSWLTWTDSRADAGEIRGCALASRAELITLVNVVRLWVGLIIAPLYGWLGPRNHASLGRRLMAMRLQTPLGRSVSVAGTCFVCPFLTTVRVMVLPAFFWLIEAARSSALVTILPSIAWITSPPVT